MKNGYTLAEVLVTLAVMGVIAGVIFPVVSKNAPNKEMLGFKKAYSIIDRATKELINDETLYPSDNGFADTSFVRFNGRTFSGESKFCGLLAAKLGTACQNETFTTADGMFWQVPNTDFANNGNITIIVDVDGVNKGENRVESVNSIKPDRFRINVTSQGHVNLNNGINAGPFATVQSYTPIEQAYMDAKDTTKSYKELKNVSVDPNRGVIDKSRPRKL